MHTMPACAMAAWLKTCTLTSPSQALKEISRPCRDGNTMGMEAISGVGGALPSILPCPLHTYALPSGVYF